MGSKVILRVSYFLQVKVVKMSLQAKDRYFQHKNIYSDLMKIQQGLIDNNYFGHKKLMRYFI
jgi:hypothetical protein